jgi:hypothetical protein
MSVMFTSVCVMAVLIYKSMSVFISQASDLYISDTYIYVPQHCYSTLVDSYPEFYVNDTLI